MFYFEIKLHFVWTTWKVIATVEFANYLWMEFVLLANATKNRVAYTDWTNRTIHQQRTLFTVALWCFFIFKLQVFFRSRFWSPARCIWSGESWTWSTRSCGTGKKRRKKVCPKKNCPNGITSYKTNLKKSSSAKDHKNHVGVLRRIL